MIRETYEETAWHFRPTDLIVIYRWRSDNGETYMRYSFAGELTGHDADQALDPDIEQAIWLSEAELQQRQAQFRSPLVLQCWQDYIAGQRYPLSLLHDS